MKYSCCKDVDKIVRRYVECGWTYRRGKKHGLLSPPQCGLFVVVPGTPSDFRTLRNLEREFKRTRLLTGSPGGGAMDCESFPHREKSTGPKSPEGKTRSAMRGYKGGARGMLREQAEALKPIA